MFGMSENPIEMKEKILAKYPFEEIKANKNECVKRV